MTGGPRAGSDGGSGERTAAPSKPRRIRPPIPIESLLRRGHWLVAGVALLGVAVVSLATALTMLRAEAARALGLVARTAAFSAEPAVAFDDAEEAAELLRLVAAREGLETIEIVLGDGRVLARAGHRDPGMIGSTVEPLVAQLFDLHARADVLRNGRPIAELRLRGDGEGIARLLLWHLAGIGAAMLASAAAVLLVSRRMRGDLAEPLDRLARFTRAVRRSRNFERRAGSARVAEIDALADDFNTLLAEMERHERELLARQAKLRTRNEALRQQAEHDALTGLPNRAAFDARLRDAEQRAAAGGHGIGLMFVDADHFKAINDEHGHDAGDAVLVEIARRLQRAVRASDVVARLGGDEFALLLDPLASRSDADAVAQKIQSSMRAPIVLRGGARLVPQVSIGVALWGADGTSAAALLRAADQAMYRTKRARQVRAAGADEAQVS